MVHPVADPGTLHLFPLRPQLLARPPLSEVVGKRHEAHAPALGGNSCDLRDRSHSPSPRRLQLRHGVQPVRLPPLLPAHGYGRIDVPVPRPARTAKAPDGLCRCWDPLVRRDRGSGLPGFYAPVPRGSGRLHLSNQLTSYVTIIIVFVGGAIWYFGARAFHLRRHGVDISMAFKELPPD